MKRIEYFAVGIAFATFAACSAQLPVSGQTADGSETFQGSGDAGMSTAAPFTMTTSTGAACSGNFNMGSLSGGVGSLTCDDGRTGDFEWSSSGGALVGTGTIGGEAMTLRLG